MPKVMVSSTFYDLKEIRQQLARMLEEGLGYTALISESLTFPIDPDVDTIENCRRRVEENADIMILVIGRRYGSVDLRSGKSITNLEYSAARAKGIPVYVFVEREAQTLYDAWDRVPLEQRAFIAAGVEDARLFEFIQRVRSIDKVWVNSFDYAEDIIRSLRAQFANLMDAGLSAQMAVRMHPDRDVLATLSGDSYRIAIDQPQYWEYYLFAKVLEDGVQSASDLRREYDLGLRYGKIVPISDSEFLPWIRNRVHEIGELETNVQAIIATLPSAFGPPGQPGNVREIVFVARQLAKIYRSVIEWSQRAQRARATADDFQLPVELLSKAGADMVNKLGSFGRLVREQIDAKRKELEENPVKPGETATLEILLTFDVDTNPMMTALAAAMALRGIKL